jgi:beta-glucosidase
VRAGSVDEADLDAIVTRLLTVFDRLDAFDDPPFADNTVDRAEDRALVRRATTSSMVLLRNDGVLPFAMAGIRTLALIGPNADRTQIMGGGSASLRPHYRVSPLDAFPRPLRRCDHRRVRAGLQRRSHRASSGRSARGRRRSAGTHGRDSSPGTLTPANPCSASR